MSELDFWDAAYLACLPVVLERLAERNGAGVAGNEAPGLTARIADNAVAQRRVRAEDEAEVAT